jgi:hypothetical protein
MSAQAARLAPRSPSRASIDAALPVELVAEDCGWGRHRHHWRDRWGIGIGGIAFPTMGNRVSEPIGAPEPQERPASHSTLDGEPCE